jgi:diadenosine tetraphosphate (Ap4A) HIT family hydrolase
MSQTFALDPRLAADTRAVISLPLCDVRLMDDARYAWLVLVPRRADVAEVTDLDADDQARLWREVASAASALRGAAPCDKIYIGAMGYIVRQLHVHVVARRVGDAAWPGPVWGHGEAVAYTDERSGTLVEALRTYAW